MMQAWANNTTEGTYVVVAGGSYVRPQTELEREIEEFGRAMAHHRQYKRWLLSLGLEKRSCGHWRPKHVRELARVGYARPFKQPVRNHQNRAGYMAKLKV